MGTRSVRTPAWRAGAAGWCVASCCAVVGVLGSASPASACLPSEVYRYAPPGPGAAPSPSLRIPANARLWVETSVWPAATPQYARVDGREERLVWHVFGETHATAPLPPSAQIPPAWTLLPPQLNTDDLPLPPEGELLQATADDDVTPPEWTGEGGPATLNAYDGVSDTCSSPNSLWWIHPHATDDFGLAAYALVEVIDGATAPRVLTLDVYSASTTWGGDEDTRAGTGTGFIGQEHGLADWVAGERTFFLVAVDFAGNVSRKAFTSGPLSPPSEVGEERTTELAETPADVIALFEELPGHPAIDSPSDLDDDASDDDASDDERWEDEMGYADPLGGCSHHRAPPGPAAAGAVALAAAGALVARRRRRA